MTNKKKKRERERERERRRNAASPRKLRDVYSVHYLSYPYPSHCLETVGLARLIVKLMVASMWRETLPLAVRKWNKNAVPLAFITKIASLPCCFHLFLMKTSNT
uniref:Uncharacterized protein n=1 Tax=Trypanosoma vivax (strain Y486) TaxID=1055687 RepID=G0TRG7_TRYVY|nr:hypothetical protein TVY486_0101790 [Trypanosoma vivax Y486]